MLSLPVAAQLHLARESRRLTVCGVVYKNDGTTVRTTQFDDDIEITSEDLAGVYFSTTPISSSDVKSGSDFSVDNLEITGKIDAISFGGFTVQDIEAGLFNQAPFEMFLCQWDEPDAWQKTIKRGYLGEISRTAEGQFSAEWRGLLQLAQQIVGRTYSELCDVKRFGDARCGLNVEALSTDTVIASAASRRRFSITGLVAPSIGYYDLGEVEFFTGLNAGFIGQIKRGSVGGVLGEIELWETMPYTVTAGDTLRIRPGCDRRFSTCQAFGNYKRFAGDGFWIPGIPQIIRAPG